MEDILIGRKMRQRRHLAEVNGDMKVVAEACSNGGGVTITIKSLYTGNTITIKETSHHRTGFGSYGLGQVQRRNLNWNYYLLFCVNQYNP